MCVCVCVCVCVCACVCVQKVQKVNTHTHTHTQNVHATQSKHTKVHTLHIHEKKKKQMYHILGKFDSRKVLCVHVFLVDDLRELSPVHHLLKHPHGNRLLKGVVSLHVLPDDPGHCRSPKHTHVRTLYIISTRTITACHLTNICLTPKQTKKLIATKSLMYFELFCSRGTVLP